MAIDPKELPEDLYRLATKAAKQHGTTWRALLREVLSGLIKSDSTPEKYAWQSAQEQAFSKVWDNDEDAIYDDL